MTSRPRLRLVATTAYGTDAAAAFAERERYPSVAELERELTPYDADVLEAERYRGPLRLGGYREGLRR